MKKQRIRKPSKYLIEIGQRFGKLTVIEKIKPNETSNQSQYLCRCDCGREKVSRPNRLFAGVTSSCGCFNRERMRQLGKENQLKNGNSTENNIILSYKYAAKSRKIPFFLTREECQKLFKGNCFYCGIKPSRTVTHGKCVLSFTYNGIDRVDNKAEYSTKNCVSCCTTCNKAKNDLSLQDFNTWIISAYKRLKQRQNDTMESS